MTLWIFSPKQHIKTHKYLALNYTVCAIAFQECSDSFSGVSLELRYLKPAARRSHNSYSEVPGQHYNKNTPKALAEEKLTTLLLLLLLHFMTGLQITQFIGSTCYLLLKLLTQFEEKELYIVYLQTI